MQPYCVTKKKFEIQIIEKFPQGYFVVKPYSEMDRGKVVCMSLYYVDCKHVATWQGGVGWFI